MVNTLYVLLFLVTNPFLNISAYVRQSKFISQPNCGQPFFQPFVEKSSSGRIIGGFESLSNSFPWYKIEIFDLNIFRLTFIKYSKASQFT